MANHFKYGSSCYVHQLIENEPLLSVEDYIKKIDQLLDRGCEFDTLDSLGRTAIGVAIKETNVNAVKALLACGFMCTMDDWKRRRNDINLEIYKYDQKDLICHIKVRNPKLTHNILKYQTCVEILKRFDDLISFNPMRFCGDFLKYIDLWVEEVHSMAEVPLQGYHKSMFDLASSSPGNISSEKLQVMKELIENGDLDTRFPCMGYLFKRTYRLAMGLARQRKAAKDSLESLLGMSLPYLCFELIVTYLDGRDLKNVIAAKVFKESL